MPKKKDKITKTTLDRYWTIAQGSRSDVDWKWFIYDLWVAGKHYARWDKDTEQIITTDQGSGDTKISINFVNSILRSVSNFISNSKPKAEVTPDDFTEDNVEDAVDATKYLDYLHDKLRLAIKMRGTIWNAMKYSVGFWQILWNEEDQEIEVNQIDPYDLYWDPDAREPREAKYAILAVKRKIENLLNDEKYDKAKVEKLKADNKKAASGLKERLLTMDKKGSDYNENDKENGTVIVKEYWYKEYDKESKSYKVYVSATAGGEMIRKPELVDYTTIIPFFRMKSDSEPLTMYSGGWVRDMIPMNKQINRIQSQLAEYNDLMNKGKWISDKNAGVRVINNENGQIIEKKRGFEVSHVPIAPLTNAIYQQERTMKGYLEEIGAAQDALQGRIPVGAKSGVAIQSLQRGNANSLSGLQMNLEDFLDECYEFMLHIASQKYQFARTISPIQYTGTREFVKIIGSDAENIPEDATVIQNKNVVRVKISSWNTMLPGERKAAILEMAAVIPDLPEDVILQAFEIGNISDIVDKIKANRERRIDEEGQQMQQQAQATATAQGKAPTEGAGAQAAIGAIRSIMQGQAPQVQPPVSQEFLAYMDSFIQGEGQNLDPTILQAIQEFRDQMVQLS